MALPLRRKGIKKSTEPTRKPHKRRHAHEARIGGRHLKEIKCAQRTDEATKDMRDELEYRFYELEHNRQIKFLECLRFSLCTACDYYEWVKMGVVWVHFENLPGKAVKALFHFLRKKKLMDSEPGAADEETRRQIRKRNAETRRYMVQLKEKVKSGQVDSGSL
ncbi:uncharacterized protein PADG_06605 [Paracoccidioides brasiliensis Pb18]|uniref:Uncharacterized protein n=1 Tax=Paracoccidioides brasiliensis (strain Pb18) TaxID=502780 RepID=C1GH69_PARBD|nr:uncharacterized protein PADG_06605 [Paracoccidioides brasiliensis Pb18]EEH50526.2 hypothetical protein PADG_06605 [Paracoccidioides brasiliensis Pb18]ODH46714.1 hypothetical protein GX48_07170 [Paracoccidioides brasiliensis]